ncbi:hypothetical protein RSAG8_12029, partial [Rhizoctonia solani AG-8 WAC10335]
MILRRRRIISFGLPTLGAALWLIHPGSGLSYILWTTRLHFTSILTGVVALSSP